MNGRMCFNPRYGDSWSLQSNFAIYSKYNTTLLRGIMIALDHETYTLSRIPFSHVLMHSVHAH